MCDVQVFLLVMRPCMGEQARKPVPCMQVAVFDTAFHQSMPASAYVYALPYEYLEKLHVRKYGFHGTSVRYLVNQV